MVVSVVQEEHAQEFIRERFEKRLETLRVRRLAGIAAGLHEAAAAAAAGGPNRAAQSAELCHAPPNSAQ
jgi:hypothetical protein